MIGITERGDAAIDYSWIRKLDSVDGAILITKNVSQMFRNMKPRSKTSAP